MEPREILLKYHRIAVVGLSPKSSRPSHGVTRYMIDQGYEVVGVRPATAEVLGRPMYESLLDIPDEVQIVNVFRASEHVPEIVKQAIQKKAKALWLQEGVTHPEAEKKATEAGIAVVSDRCILKEHAKI